MLYLYIDKNRVKLLYLKKSLLGQYEASFFEKKHEIDLLAKGTVKNIDVLASALKEGMTNIGQGQIKDVMLILPQESFYFLRTSAPKDIATATLDSFVKDKARASLPLNVENSFYDFFIKEDDKQKQINFFAIDASILESYLETLNLLGLKLVSVTPESLASFKLFEKTLRKEKKENILFVSNFGDEIFSYLFDSLGLVSPERWTRRIVKDEKLEEILKEKRGELEEKGTKLQRIILSGESSEGIRQDTFTKNVGVWTNPLKRIVPNFYQDYLKQLVVAQGQTFPLLAFDICFGAFVFSQENRDFQILKKPLAKKAKKAFTMPRTPIFRKEVLIFLASAILSFGVFVGLSRLDMDFSFVKNLVARPTPTPKPQVKKETPTPQPKIKKEELRIRVLNGSGEAGKASEVQDLLQEKGYQEIVTGNADNFDYTQTIIRVKKSVSSAADLLKKDLSDSISQAKIETLPEDDTSDVTIIVGADFE